MTEIKEINPEKIYVVAVNRAVQVGRVWLRPGTSPHLLGSAVIALGDAVTAQHEVGA